MWRIDIIVFKMYEKLEKNNQSIFGSMTYGETINKDMSKLYI